MVTSLDSFPEAFERFENDVDIGQFESSPINSYFSLLGWREMERHTFAVGSLER
jgi:hypothetical protein